MKEKVLILTGLFFNNTGNQSFYEMVKGYAKHFEVALITAADLKDYYYLSFDKAKQLFPGVRLIRTKSAVLNVAKLAKKALFKPSKKRRKVEKCDSKLVNARVSYFSKKAFLARETLLKKEALHLIRTEAYRPKYICAYEINGVRPAIQIRCRLRVHGRLAKLCDYPYFASQILENNKVFLSGNILPHKLIPRKSNMTLI